MNEDVKESAKEQTKEREERPPQIISDILSVWRVSEPTSGLQTLWTHIDLTLPAALLLREPTFGKQI